MVVEKEKERAQLLVEKEEQCVQGCLWSSACQLCPPHIVFHSPHNNVTAARSWADAIETEHSILILL